MLQTLFTGLICGALLGSVMQRGRFCLTGGFRDMYLAKNNHIFYALLIAIAIQSVGVYTLIAAGQFSYDAGAFPWLGTIVGGYVFGIGIVMAGGCATGTWYRAGEGLIGSWIALAAYMLTSAVMRSPHLARFNQHLASFHTAHNSMADTLGLSPWLFIAAKGSGEFRLRAADAATSMRSCAGGILMGFGATTAGGCSIGNGLVMTAMLTWQGWVGLAFMILGVWTASWYLFVRPRRRVALRAASA